MGQKSEPRKESAEQVVKENRRASGGQFSAENDIRRTVRIELER
jgi:hypothetical protein